MCCTSSLNAIRLERGEVLEPFIRVGGTAIPHSRQRLLTEALAWGAQKLVFIDADVSFSPSQFRTLLDAPCKAVTGSYAQRPQVQAKTAEELIPTARFQGSYPTQFDENGLAPIDNAGFGFLRVDREVIVALAPHRVRIKGTADGWDRLCHTLHRAWFPYGYEQVGTDDNGEPLYEESTADVCFIRSMIRLGHQPMLHKDLICGHWDGPIEYRHKG